jgi:hypothetical protein
MQTMRSRHHTVGDTTTTTVGGTTTTTVGGPTTTTTVGTTTTTVGTTTTTAGGTTTTTTTVGGTTTTTTEPAPGEKPCSADEGLASHSAISVDKSSAHPSASVRFTVKEGCEVLAFLASGKFTDDSIEDVDFAPQDRSPLFGPGDYELTVRLPDCADFIVDFFVLEPPPEAAPEAAPTMMAQARSEAAQAMTEGQGPLAPGAIEEVVDTTTNCPTETTNAKAVTTTVGGGQLPGTGANALPLLIAGLVLVVGGAAALLASRMRSRQAK